MTFEIRQKFKKRSWFWTLTRLGYVLLLAAFLYLSIMEMRNGIIFMSIFSGLYFIAVTWIPDVIINKTAKKINSTDFNVSWSCRDRNCYFMLDMKKGLIAAIFVTMPFKIQYVDAAKVEDAEVTLGIKLKNRKTTNKVGTVYWLGEQKNVIYTYQAGKQYVVLASEPGRYYVRSAHILKKKLLQARSVALGLEGDSSSRDPVIDSLSQALYTQIDMLVFEGQSLKAIKTLRDASGIGLAHAKEIIDQWEIA